ncbi:MAG: GTP pyrophosphokinase [Candidatus Aminicenantaceae bacterium]
MADLDRALRIASDAHRGQKDRYGDPYILHPLRVMLHCRSESERLVALLHDVVEKSERTFDDLSREGFASEVIAAVERLTKRPGEPYLDYIVRAREDALARAVKQADLQDHMDAILARGRVPEASERMKRYREAMHLLLQEEGN